MSAKWPGGETLSRDKVAIVYATGAIMDGGDGRESVNSPRLAQEIYEAGEDERIKALVLRVNSPGGSAIGSETILHALKKVKKEKPVIISMGNVAASGGYYISCASDTILATRNTLTGSIGVIGMMFNAQNLLNEKLGISFDGYKTGPFADFPNVTRPLSEREYKWMNQMMDSVYHTFVSRVSDGRKLDYETVDSLGQGRVWIGTDAVNNNLVDMTGGLLDAIDIAAKKAGLEQYRVVELPYLKDPFLQMMEDLSGEGISIFQKIKYGSLYSDILQLQKLTEFEGFMTRIPIFYPLH
jgi:protease-4